MVIDAANRPAWLVRADTIEITRAGGFADLLEGNGAALRPVIRRVGRILAGSEAIGTGLLIAEDRVLTNRHVFDRMDGPATFELGPERGSPGTGLELGDSVTIVNSMEVDVAVLEVAETETPEPVSWSTAPVDRAIAVVGYPYEESSHVPEVQANIASVFGGVFDVQRVAPGMVLASTRRELEHDASTLRGNSGSPIVDLRTGAIVGLHHRGDRDRGRAVATSALQVVLNGVVDL